MTLPPSKLSTALLPAALLIFAAGCASQSQEPQHPLAVDYCNGGVLLCTGTDGNAIDEPGEDINCRCNRSSDLSNGSIFPPGAYKPPSSTRTERNRQRSAPVRSRQRN